MLDAISSVKDPGFNMGIKTGISHKDNQMLICSISSTVCILNLGLFEWMLQKAHPLFCGSLKERLCSDKVNMIMQTCCCVRNTVAHWPSAVETSAVSKLSDHWYPLIIMLRAVWSAGGLCSCVIETACFGFIKEQGERTGQHI